MQWCVLHVLNARNTLTPPLPVSSRIISWTAVTSAQLEGCLNKGFVDRKRTSFRKCVVTEYITGEKRSDSTTLAGQLARAMAIIQGVTLTHKPSKQSLGRRYSLEVMLYHSQVATICLR